MTTASISTMPRRRRCFPRRAAAIAARLRRLGQSQLAACRGREARAPRWRKRARRIAEALGWRHDVIFTCGASEAIEIAAARARIAGRAHGATEHAIVPHAMGPASRVMPVDAGRPDRRGCARRRSLAEGPALVAIQAVNNETGIIQPLDRLAPRIREAGSLLLADCAQSAGKLPLPDADFIALSAHKLGGPPGIGALLVRDLATLEPVGGQEKGYRRGHAGRAERARPSRRRWRRKPYDMERLAALRARLDEASKAAGGVVIGEDSPRIADDRRRIACPARRARRCWSSSTLPASRSRPEAPARRASMKASAVLAAMGVAPDIAGGFLRISFGPRHERGRCRCLPRRMARGSPSAPRRAA